MKSARHPPGSAGGAKSAECSVACGFTWRLRSPRHEFRLRCGQYG